MDWNPLFFSLTLFTLPTVAFLIARRHEMNMLVSCFKAFFHNAWRWQMKKLVKTKTLKINWSTNILWKISFGGMIWYFQTFWNGFIKQYFKSRANKVWYKNRQLAFRVQTNDAIDRFLKKSIKKIIYWLLAILFYSLSVL